MTAAAPAPAGTPTLGTPVVDPAAFLLDETVKGMPPGVAPFPIGEIAGQRWNLLAEDLPLPLAVLKRSALDHNLDWMARFVGDAGAVLAPHGKTTMAPGLFREQVEHGSWRSPSAPSTGDRRPSPRHPPGAAGQPADRPRAIRGALDMLREDPGFELLALVDSLASVEMLAKAAAAPVGRPVPVLLEIGYAGATPAVATPTPRSPSPGR
jgi:D-serine dehydratase